MKNKKIASPEFYNDRFVLGYIKNKRFFKWTYIVADDRYMDSLYFPDVFGPKEDLEPLLVSLMQVHANIQNKRVELTQFMQDTLSPEILKSSPIVKGRYIYPDEINDPNIAITIHIRNARSDDEQQ